MSTFRIIYPDIPTINGSYSPPSTLLDPFSTTEKGDRSTYFKSPANVALPIIFDTANSLTPAPTYAAIVDAQSLARVNTFSLQIANSNDNTFATGALSNSFSFSESSLVGPQKDIALASISGLNATARYVRTTFTHTVAKEKRFQKFFVGQHFDFDVEPLRNREYISRPNNQTRKTIMTGDLTFQGLSSSKLQSYLSVIDRWKDAHTYVFVDTSGNILDGHGALYCRITASSIRWLQNDEADVTIKFEELP